MKYMNFYILEDLIIYIGYLWMKTMGTDRASS